jgi:hypothetical protein
VKIIIKFNKTILFEIYIESEVAEEGTKKRYRICEKMKFMECSDTFGRELDP